MAENRILRFDFSGDDPKVLPVPKQTPDKATTQEPIRPKKTISPEQRAAMNEGKQREQLTPRERKFCAEYIKDYNGAQAIFRSGYNASNTVSASVQANALLKTRKIQKEIDRLTRDDVNNSIADAREVMQFFTDVMRGKIKDQFGLEASLAERAKAAQEVAKRTIDIENRAKAAQSGENAITIKLDWEQS